MKRTEQLLREIWTERGIPKERQDAMISWIIAQAQPGVAVGPFVIAGDRK